jgi:glycosyltransferase involved in cell wall biosynthesis
MGSKINDDNKGFAMNEKSADNEILLDYQAGVDFSMPLAKASAIVVLLNFEENLSQLYESLKNVLTRNFREFEIIFVDDASADNTYQRLSEIIAADSRVKIIKMRSTFGEASAFDAGLKLATGDIIIYFTGRVNIKVHDLPNLFKKLNEGYDLVTGWRSPRKDARLNQAISKLFNSITTMFSGHKLHDISSGVIVLKTEVLKNIQLYGNWDHFLPVIAERQGYKVTEAKIAQLPGKFRKSLYLREYLQRFLDIITVIFLTNYSKKPIHFLGFVGILLTIVGAGIELYLFIYRILGLGPIAGRPLLLLGALFLVIGIQMISIGLLGEMIIFTHAGDIREYNIEKIVEK